MQRYRQTFEEIIAKLSPIATGWQDEFAGSVIQVLGSLPARDSYSRADLRTVLESNFEAGMMLIRLFLDLSQDEFRGALKAIQGKAGVGVKSFRSDPDAFLAALEKLGALEKITATVQTPLTWRDLLIERLK